MNRSPVLLATRSSDKLREITEILAVVPRLRILSLDEAGIGQSPDEEDIEVFETFIENARAKADWFGRRTGLPTLADDSGLCVDALGGAPGVRSKRLAGDPLAQGQQLDRANNDALLQRLATIDPARRGAAYVCAAVCRLPDGSTLEALGSVRGRILDAPAGSAGFGYDPLFLLPPLNRTFGEIPAAMKHRFSHRARAFRALAAHLESLPG